MFVIVLLLPLVSAGVVQTTQDDPHDKNLTLLCSDKNISLSEGYQEVESYVGGTCRLIFPKNQSVVTLKRNGSKAYVGGCRNGHSLGKALDSSFSSQVEFSNCSMLEENFILTFKALTPNCTGLYLWTYDGKNGSFHLNVTGRVVQTTQDDPHDKNLTLLCSDKNISLSEGYQEVESYVGGTCRLIFPKNQSVVTLKRNGSKAYVGGCRNGHGLGKALDSSFSSQVEFSNCSMLEENFILTFKALTPNCTGLYLWTYDGKNGSFHLNVTGRGGGNMGQTSSVPTVVGVVVGVVVVVSVVVLAVSRNKEELKTKFDALKEYFENCCRSRNSVI